MRRATLAVLAAAALSLAGCGREADVPTPRVSESVLFDTMAVIACLGLVAGVGCAAAVFGAAFPAVARANDRTARESGATVPMLVGALVVLGALAALSGAGKAGWTPTWIVLILIALPTSLLWIAGLTACAPLLGERLGAGGVASSPLRRSIVASLAIGFALAPCVISKFFPATILLGLVVFGWPTGVALLTTIARFRRPAPPPPPPAPPAP